METIRSGSLRPSSFSFMLTVMTKFPPAESPTNTICSPVVPGEGGGGGEGEELVATSHVLPYPPPTSFRQTEIKV